MAITTEDRRTPGLTSPAPPRASKRGRATLAWGAGIAALAATTALVIAVAANDDTTPEPNLHYDVGDAKDHPQYNPYVPSIVQADTQADVTDAKDHPQYNPYVPPIGQTLTSTASHGGDCAHRPYPVPKCA